jgi:hypothetical protein
MYEGHESLYVCVSKIQKLKIKLNKKTLSYLFFIQYMERSKPHKLNTPLQNKFINIKIDIFFILLNCDQLKTLFFPLQ